MALFSYIPRDREPHLLGRKTLANLLIHFSPSPNFKDHYPNNEQQKIAPLLRAVERTSSNLGVTTGAPPTWLDSSPLDPDFLVLGLFLFFHVSGPPILVTFDQGQVPQGQVPQGQKQSLSTTIAAN
jgi:hypothetical protein